jgi:hypothetical protein
MKRAILNSCIALALVSSFLVLFFFSSLVLYDKVCFYEMKLYALVFEWLLAFVIFVISLYAFIALIMKHYEIKLVKR